MGRYDFAAQKVHKHVSHLLQMKKMKAPPAWFNVVGEVPSSEILTRKATHTHRSPRRKASRMFLPVQIKHTEDDLRWEFFNDHPWELARPRVVLENDGRDHERWDWSHPLCRPRYKHGRTQEETVRNRAETDGWIAKQITQSGRPLNGEAVVQRQQWLMRNENMTQSAAYDKARKEFYSARHAQEIEQRIAKEEAMFYGAQFGPSALDIGMHLEDQAYEQWREWAAREIATAKQVSNSAYTGNEAEEMATEDDEIEVAEVTQSVPGSKSGQRAFGGAAVHP